MLMRLLLAALIVFLPNTLHFPIDTGIPGLNLANVLLVVLVIALALGGRNRDPMPAGPGYLTAPLIGLFVVLCIGFVIAQMTMPISFLNDVTALKNAIFYPLFYFVYRRSRQDLQGTRQLIILVMLVAAVAGVEAIREGMNYGIGRYSPTHRASGPFGTDSRNANRAGVFFAMFLPMFIAMALFFRHQKVWRLAAIGGCAILAFAIMVTYSRQAYLIGLFGWALLVLRRSLLMAILAGLLMVASGSLLPVSVTQRAAETQQSTATGGEELDLSTASRFDIWAGAMEMFGDHPAGVGLNRFKNHIGNYTSYRGFDAHNFYVLMLAECGPLGLAALLWLLWRLLGLARAFGRFTSAADPESRALALGFPIVIISMALGNTFGSPFFEGSVMANFWILCGLLERYASLKRHAAATHPRPVSPHANATIRDRFPLASRWSPGLRRAAICPSTDGTAAETAPPPP